MSEINVLTYDEATGILVGRYNEHLDISKVHKKILGILQWREDEGLISLDKLAKQGLSMLSTDQEVTIDDCSQIMQKGFNSIVRMSSKREYEVRARPHLKRIGAAPASDPRDRLAYIETFFNMVRAFLRTNISYSGLHNSHGGDEECEQCGAELVEDSETCLKCGLLVTKALEPAAYIDIKPSAASVPVPVGDQDGFATGSPLPTVRGNKGARKNDRDALYIKFQELLSRWKGTSGIAIDPNDLRIIGSYLSVHHDSMTLDDRCWPLNAEILIKALKKTQNAKYVPDLNLVAEQLWKRPIPHIGGHAFESRLESQWRQVQEVLPAKEGVKLAANGWRLWHQLVQAGYDCERKEFDMPASITTLETWEKLWDEVCVKLGWINPYRGEKGD